VTLCSTCHEGHHKDLITLKVKTGKSYRAPAFMNAVRYKIVDELRSLDIPVEVTFGYKTKSKRISENLEKTHINDAYAMAGGRADMQRHSSYHIRQVRKSNRKLRKGKRSEISYVLPREVHGYRVYDKVKWNNCECFIIGRRKTGYFCLGDIKGKKFPPLPKGRGFQRCLG